MSKTGLRGRLRERFSTLMVKIGCSWRSSSKNSILKSWTLVGAVMRKNLMIRNVVEENVI